MAPILAQVSLGELIDKITILQIKSQNLQGLPLQNVKTELTALETTLNNLGLDIEPKLIQNLKDVNQSLWNIEDEIRDQERKKFSTINSSSLHVPSIKRMTLERRSKKR